MQQIIWKIYNMLQKYELTDACAHSMRGRAARECTRAEILAQRRQKSLISSPEKPAFRKEKTRLFLKKTPHNECRNPPYIAGDFRVSYTDRYALGKDFAESLKNKGE